MKTIVALVLAATCIATVASAKEKKPTVCFAFSEAVYPIGNVEQKVAVCLDGKKPVVLTTYSFVQFKDEDGAAVKAIIGYK